MTQNIKLRKANSQGYSYSLTLPKPLMRENGFHEGDKFQVKIAKGKIVKIVYEKLEERKTGD